MTLCCLVITNTVAAYKTMSTRLIKIEEKDILLLLFVVFQCLSILKPDTSRQFHGKCQSKSNSYAVFVVL